MNFPQPPRGIKALPWRLPILIYRLGLGWMMGKGFLLLEHIGRKSGKLRRAVLEVVSSSPESGRYYVVSGFGPGSHWYQNVLHNPQVTIQVGRKRFRATAQQLPPEQAAKLMLTYSEEHPGNLKALSSLLGYEIELTPQGIQDFGREIPVIQFSVDSPMSEDLS
ncbi:MAG: nitroreductase family deazaflavin-dependent oxidoreductase [Anaerolineales bacterium]|jgi:deazaflavin-dependent oxidoreductase (nitroreductase family)